MFLSDNLLTFDLYSLIELSHPLLDLAHGESAPALEANIEIFVHRLRGVRVEYLLE